MNFSAIQELIVEKENLDDQIAELETHLSKTKTRKSELEAESAKLEETNDAIVAKTAATEDTLLQREERLFEREQWVGLDRVGDEKKELITIEEWLGSAPARAILEDPLQRTLLLLAVAAFLDRSMLLMNGDVGTGKTTAVRTLGYLLGVKPEICAVRPGWVDATDLLGFFDPLQRIFVPGPFSDFLYNCKKNPGRAGIFCLDELNISRMENYGSDLLTAIGQQGVKLRLYPESIHKSLWTEFDHLQSGENDETKLLDGEKVARVELLKENLGSFSYHMEFPEESILTGTLNTDFSTHQLSPKIIDRSYILPFAFSDSNAASPPSNTSTSDQPAIAISGLMDLVKEYSKSTSLLATKIPEEIKKHLSALRIRNNHRLESGYRALLQSYAFHFKYMDKTSDKQEGGMQAHEKAVEQALACLLLTRVLPKIRIEGEISKSIKESLEAFLTAIEKAQIGKLEGSKFVVAAFREAMKRNEPLQYDFIWGSYSESSGSSASSATAGGGTTSEGDDLTQGPLFMGPPGKEFNDEVPF
ncbi:hypothetical protein OAU96_00490 [Planctomycetota bacterium]|nr:hypothetical protein [Planctomycetota bacterium]